MTRIRTAIYLTGILFFNLICGCRCDRFFYVNNGKDWKENKQMARFTDIHEQDFILSVHLHDSDVTFKFLTKFNAPMLIKERGVTVTFKQLQPILETQTELIRYERESLLAYTDSTMKQRVKDEYYTCENFQQEIKKSKKLYLKITYDLDSNGITRPVEKQYVLYKKHICYFSAH